MSCYEAHHYKNHEKVRKKAFISPIIRNTLVSYSAFVLFFANTLFQIMDYLILKIYCSNLPQVKSNQNKGKRVSQVKMLYSCILKHEIR